MCPAHPVVLDDDVRGTGLSRAILEVFTLYPPSVVVSIFLLSRRLSWLAFSSPALSSSWKEEDFARAGTSDLPRVGLEEGTSLCGRPRSPQKVEELEELLQPLLLPGLSAVKSSSCGG